MAEDAYATTVHPQYRDLDPQGHVNQAVYFSWLEQARTNYWAEVVGERHDLAPLAVKRQEIEYIAPVTLEDSVTVAQRITDIGTTSFDIAYEIRTDDGRVATAEVVLVAIDRETGRSVPIPETWRRPITAFEGL
ncbi:Acyl-CoA thioesterase FadM [Halanaeroarchaeum sp. HSR-CO]|uniref:acyl-CoA thioesterase n=1 Tax=Halanaeroarchaeum sp. HSR-CO TaxID=2866382 RepID=UPI00217E6110|nr:thioesterase family protein [Halanaeroarchaeum sp. HSR-CO]UWG47079.1 Acyl-CoA thioesterase FadM [Halanaeroarchaeum sp. HSR-CO]